MASFAPYQDPPDENRGYSGSNNATSNSTSGDYLSPENGFNDPDVESAYVNGGSRGNDRINSYETSLPIR